MKFLKPDRGGFTVLECMVIIGILSILIAMAIPGFISLLPGFRLGQAARQIATDLQSARMRAISQNASNTITFNSSTGTYVASLGGETRDIQNLYPGITLTASASPAFSARGTATTPATVTLSNGTATKLVEVTPVGRVRIP